MLKTCPLFWGGGGLPADSLRLAGAGRAYDRLEGGDVAAAARLPREGEVFALLVVPVLMDSELGEAMKLKGRESLLL